MAIIFMGHGSVHEANQTYITLQDCRKTVFQRNGVETTCIPDRLGQYPGIWQICVELAGRLFLS